MVNSPKSALPENIIGIYERRAHEFDQDRVNGKIFFEKDWLDLFINHLPKKPDATPSVLDIGCGSARPIARYLLRNKIKVSGVDSSNAMIALCQERFPDNAWTVADMRTLSLGETFDGLIAWDSFFHLTRDDQRAMFAIFKAHANPGAALMFTSGHYNGEAFGALRDEALYHSSLDETEYRTLLGANGFKVIKHTAQDPACGGHTVWLAQIVR